MRVIYINPVVYMSYKTTYHHGPGAATCATAVVLSRAVEVDDLQVFHVALG